MINYFFNNILKFDFMNKFTYFNLFNIPKFIKICFIFFAKNFKSMLTSLILLYIFCNKTKKFLLNFKNNMLINCKVYFKNKLLNKILIILVIEVLPFLTIFNFYCFFVSKLLLFRKLKNFNIILINNNLKIILNLDQNNKHELNYLNKNIKIIILV